MRLSKLEIIGFKSFAKKTELEFSDGITAIIGPNGSGKSNISDAVRWVLGEQSARALRGSKMEDIIFNGTQEKKSTGYCEVTLLFDNSDHTLNIPQTDVSITRRLFRDGESEYAINKTNCRLKDVQELFHDTGIGKDGYSIISQGKVDEILSNKSNERRTALEEAAGIMRYRTRKEESERKLDNTEKNLVRIEDIISELSDRIGPLEIQSKKAEEYLKLQNELKDLEINQFLYVYDRTHEKLNSSEKIIQELNERENVLTKESDMLLIDESEYDSHMSELDGIISAQQNSFAEMLTKIESLKGERNVYTERKERILKDIDILQERIDSESKQIIDLKELILTSDNENERASSIDKLNSEILEYSKMIENLDTEIQETENELNDLKTSIMDAMNKMADTKSDLSRFNTMEESLLQQINTFLSEEEKYGYKLDTLNKELSENGRIIDGLLNKKQEILTSQNETKEQLSTLEIEYQETNEHIISFEQELNVLESKERMIADMIETHEGYFNSVRNLLNDRKTNKNIGNKIVGVVAELLQVPSEYETAIHMALGSTLQNIVTKTAEDAQDIIDYLRSKEYGRVTILPLNLIQTKTISDEEYSYIRGNGIIGLASEIVKCDDSLIKLLDYLLGRTVIVKDLACGIALKKITGTVFQIATLEGDIIGTSGAMTGGSIKKNEISFLNREREIVKLREKIQKTRSENTQLKERSESIRRDILLLNVQMDAFREELNNTEIELVKRNESHEIILRDMEFVNESIQNINNEIGAINENLTDIREERNASLSKKNEIESGSINYQDNLKHAQELMNGLRKKKEASLKEVSDQRVRLTALEKEHDAIIGEKSRLNKEITVLKEDIDKCLKQIETYKEQINSTDCLIENSSSETAKMEERIKLLQDEQKNIEDEKLKMYESQIEKRKKRESMLDELRSITERKHRTEITNSRIEMELNSLQDRIWDEYEITYENALPFKHDIQLSGVQTRIAEIKTEIRDLGDVNISAIDDFRNVTERYTNLALQRDDLRKAQCDLIKLIGELTSTMKTVFKKEFTYIQKNFETIFTELFGGGRAELKLSDETDVLNCDIEIIAQPPGKKLQLLSLLSGGERALTAIALLFAMLKLKPPAFCVLDEIESSLDEANVSRFAQYLKNYADNTQFIIITHRKGSMEACNTLYGVSMEERGISKVVSAKFDEVTA